MGLIGWLLGWIVVGAILGALARLLLPGRDPMGLGATIPIGIAGQLLGGLIFGVLLGGIGAGWIAGLVCSVGLVYLSRRTGIGRRSLTR
ncbi:MAG TPA: hypothetical protein VKV06_16080 [Acidimicrobiales bacterium]|nr:hypothetical protein [Acidimicrobiales bacterium]